MSNLVADEGFEAPVLTPATFAYNPAGGAWAFTGFSGIASNGSGFGNPTAPEGVQCAILQGTSFFDQVVTFPSTGDYPVSYKSANRELFSDQTIEFSIDGTLIDTFNPGSQSYQPHSFTAIGVTAGNHTVRLTGTSGTLNTCFVDIVDIEGTLPPGVPRVNQYPVDVVLNNDADIRLNRQRLSAAGDILQSNARVNRQRVTAAGDILQSNMNIDRQRITFVLSRDPGFSPGSLLRNYRLRR